MKQSDLDKFAESIKHNEIVNSESSKCYLYALRLLTRRDYSQHKLQEKLKERGYKGEEISKAIGLLLEKNYLREDLYKEARIKGLMRKGLAPDSIRRKMEQEKCPTTSAEIFHLFAEQNYTSDEQIVMLVKKKMPSTWPQDKESSFKLETKILRFLISKGHTYENSKKAFLKTKKELFSEINN